MFSFEQITALHEMGFTPDQITKFATISPDTIPGDPAGTDPGEAAPSPGPAISTAPPPDPAISDHVDNPVETVEKPPEPDALSEIKKEIENLRASIQAQNIKTQSIEVVRDEDQLEKAMAEFIRPSYNNNEERK